MGKKLKEFKVQSRIITGINFWKKTSEYDWVFRAFTSTYAGSLIFGPKIWNFPKNFFYLLWTTPPRKVIRARKFSRYFFPPNVKKHSIIQLLTNIDIFSNNQHFYGWIKFRFNRQNIIRLGFKFRVISL